MSSMTLPDDVIQEILTRLPAKSIINCRCVCKTWFSLISERDFVKRHLDHTIHSKKQSKFMCIIEDATKPYYPLISTVSYDDTLYSSSFMSGDEDYVEIDPPLIDFAYPVHFLGSVNGLICIMFHTSVVDGLVPFFVIWNPTTREYKILPPSQNRVTDKKEFSIYSFGYDHKSDNYKLVKAEFLQDGFVELPPTSEEDVHAAEIYSLESDSWRIIETIPYHMLRYVPYDSVSGVLVNGVRHWLAKRKYLTKGLKEDFIVSFDFSDERFKQMQLPKSFQNKTAWRPLWTVGVLEECLCVVRHVWEPCIQVEIWVMQDYGVQESWTKRFVICSTETRDILNLDPARVIWSFKDDKFLLLKIKDKRQFVLYDPKQDTVTSCSKVIRGAENYVESLVSLNSDIYVGSAREYTNILRASWTKSLRLFDGSNSSCFAGIDAIIRNDTDDFVACYGKQHILETTNNAEEVWAFRDGVMLAEQWRVQTVVVET
ncbi:F-box protein CPR1-like [Papaver somniferum]|uniref:F-box protein CPR1-like n=1 Tax=Papaver somniferum TaxID=3469 RepID=UPI000E704965|nr:F-box protein CPR1-like [Papaver somniferum]